ncbi:MAG: hypothetical protein IH921_06395 [Gemmatimonadetes bacterium]|nr:hypothetical protein [Gemmatimonadota bacterium]
MKATERRLANLYPSLTAKERAILVLKAWKEDGDEGPLVRETMPPEQGVEFNRLIDLMKAVNRELGPYLVLLHALVDQLGTKHGWLMSLKLWGIQAGNLAAYIWLHTKEPVTENEHQRLIDGARDEMVPASELADVLVERYEGWDEADFEPNDDGDDEPSVTEKAWNRVLSDKKREIARLVDDGALSGKRKGRRLLVSVGSFYDWLGEPAPVHPEWGVEFEVFPDSETDKVKWLKRERSDVQKALARSPMNSALVFDWGKFAPDRQGSSRGPPSQIDEACIALLESLKEGVETYWQEMRAAQRVLAQAAEEFDGEDPLLPKLRGVLDGVQKELEDLHEQAKRDIEPLELPEPDEEVLARVRSLVQPEADR